MTTNVWTQAIEGRYTALQLQDPQVLAAARLIGLGLDLGLITLEDAAAVNQMHSGDELEEWLTALAVDVMLATNDTQGGEPWNT